MQISKKSSNASSQVFKHSSGNSGRKGIVVVNSKPDFKEEPQQENITKKKKQHKNNEEINTQVYEQQCEQIERSTGLDQFIESEQGNQENENQ